MSLRQAAGRRRSTAAAESCPAGNLTPELDRSVKSLERGTHHDRSRHRRHRPQPDRPGQQGVARRPAPRRHERPDRRRRCMAKVPQVQPSDVERRDDGHRPARRRGWLQHRTRGVGRSPGCDDVPGVTVNRYCSSSLQTIRMAFHAIKAGEGDCFIAAGVEAVSRYASGASGHRAQPDLQAAGRAHQGPRPGRPGHVDAAGRAARHVHRDGPDRRERGRGRGHQPRRDGPLRRALAEPRLRPRRQRLLRARDHAADAARRHRRQQGRRPAPGHQLRDRQPAEAGVPSRRHHHGRQRLPAERRRRGGAWS